MYDAVTAGGSLMAELSMGRKAAYSMGGIAMNLTNLVISQWIYKLYVPSPQEALVPVWLFGAIFFLGRLTDGITDPLVAYWSDQLRSRRGRRIPFILFGLGPLALVFFLLWLPPTPGLHWSNALWAFVFIQAYFVLYTIVVTPYLALIPEITSDLRERVNITTLQAVAVMVGTAVFAVIGVVIEAWGWAALGGVVAALCIVSFAPTLVWIREHPRPVADEGAEQRFGLIEWMRLTFQNRPFLHLVVATSFYWFGLNLLIMLVPYWVQDLLGLGEGDVPILMGPFLAMNLVCFFVFNAAAKVWGKHAAFLVTLAGSALVVPALSLVGHLPFGSALVQSAVVMGLIGVPTAGFMMLPFALLADVVDYDEQLTGQRREAIYFGMQAVLQKTMIGASIFAFGMLVLGGQTTSIAGLKAVPLVAATSFVLGFVTFLRYPLREREGKVTYIGGS